MLERNWDIVIGRLEELFPDELVKIILGYYYVKEHPYPEDIYLDENSFIKQIKTYKGRYFSGFKVIKTLIYSKYEQFYLSIWEQGGEYERNYQLIVDIPLEKYIKEHWGESNQLQEQLIAHNFC